MGDANVTSAYVIEVDAQNFERSVIEQSQTVPVVVDAGTLVNPDGALAQIQGGALWGASMALHEGTAFEKGQVKDTNLDTYMPLRIGDVPDMVSDGRSMEGDRVLVLTREPVSAAQVLTTWAVDHDIDLGHFSVTQPTLEDIYLELTGAPQQHTAEPWEARV